MARDDWRIRVEVDEAAQVESGFSVFARDLSPETTELAKELEGQRLAVSRDGNVLFVYASSRLQADQALRVVEAALAENGVEAHTSSVEQWLGGEERWDDEAPGPDAEADLLERGFAPWEVRVECDSHAEARRLADELEAEGYSVERRWRYLIAGAASREDAVELARRVHGEVEPGGELVYEVAPQNPFAFFGGMGGSGTPLG